MYFEGIKIPSSTDKKIKKIKKELNGHAMHGNKVWNSTFVLMDVLKSIEIKDNKIFSLNLDFDQKLIIILLIKKNDFYQSEKIGAKFYYYAKKPTSGLKAKDKLRMKKYNPATKKHEWFIEKKLPPHSK